MTNLSLIKLHALGNDFLVLLDADGRQPVDGTMARALCDRSRGVGADGLIRSTLAAGGAATMELYNADGSRAEMSGNGISCLAQALVDARLVDGGEIAITTDAGLRTVRLEEGRATVDMGDVILKEHEEGGFLVDVGNPHLVLQDEGQDLEEIGRAHPDLNVELVLPAGGGEIAMRVHERGVGITDACGTGAVASAAAGREWGLNGDRTVVRQPGGHAIVDLAGTTATLTVPVVHVGRVEVPCP
jgi:diaminopimelate epimerase